MKNQLYTAVNHVSSLRCKLFAVWQVCADETYHVSRRPDARDALIAVRTKAGNGRIVTRRGMLEVPPQSLIFFRAKDILQYGTNGAVWDFLWFEFACAYLELPMEQILMLQIDKTETMYSLECMRSLVQAGAEQAQYGASVFAALLSYWAALSDVGLRREHLLLQQIVYEIHTQLEQNWTVAGIAAHYHLSERTLRNLFYRQMGCAPIAYIRGCRLAAAREMLHSTNMLIKEIGIQVGYRDPYYFSRDFKRVFGMSPQQYQAEHNKE